MSTAGTAKSDAVTPKAVDTSQPGARFWYPQQNSNGGTWPRKVNNSMISNLLQDIATQNGVTVLYDYHPNQAICNSKTIHMGTFDDIEREELAFFHELGHAMSDTVMRGRSHFFSMLSREGLAWEVGLGIAFQHGLEWHPNHPAMIWARTQFETYGHQW